jgi:hypothetical protein
MKNLKLILIALSLVLGFTHQTQAAYSVYDARANSILRQIKGINNNTLNTVGNILNVNQDELEVLNAIYRVIGEPSESQRILTGEGSSGQTAQTGGDGGTFGNSSTTPDVMDIAGSITSGLDGVLGDVENIMANIPGYEDFDIGSMFKGMGHIDTFINGDFEDFKDFLGDPSEQIANELKKSVFGTLDGTLLSDVESRFGKRLLRISEANFEGNRARILTDISKLFMSRVMENVSASAQRNEVLAAETQQAYDEAAKAETLVQQMAAQNRIDAGNNMIELEKTRVINETAAAEVSLQAKEVDVLEFQELDRNLDNALE